MFPVHPTSTLFPYTTLFRSGARADDQLPAAAAFEYFGDDAAATARRNTDRKSTRLNSSHTVISYAVFCLKTKRCFYSSKNDSDAYGSSTRKRAQCRGQRRTR